MLKVEQGAADEASGGSDLRSSRSKRWLVGLAAVVAALAAASTASPTGAGFIASSSTNFQIATGSYCSAGADNPVWMTGMEHGTVQAPGPFTTINTTGGTPVIETGTVRSGTYSLKVPKATSGANASAVRSFASPAATALVARVALRLNARPTADVTRLFAIATASGAIDAGLGYESSSNKLQLRAQGQTFQLASTTFNPNTWYVIDLRYTTGASSTVDWKIDGVAQTGIAFSQTATTVSLLRLGSGTLSDEFTAFYDDISVSTTSADFPLAEGQILSVAPNSSVARTVSSDASNSLLDDAGGTISTSSWNRLDEVPMSGLADYVKQTAVDASAYAQVGFTDLAAGTCPRYVAAMAGMHSSSTTANSAKTSIFDGATETVVDSGDVSPGTGTSEMVYKFLPFTGGGSGLTTFNALTARIGYASNVASQPYWDSLRLEYEIPPPSSCAGAADNPVWMTGMEHGTVQASGVFNQIVTTAGAPVADSTTVRNGIRSLKIPKAGTGSSYVSVGLGSVQSAVVRVAVRIGTPSADVTRLVGLPATAAVLPAIGWDWDTQRFQLRVSALGNPVAAGSAMDPNTWHTLQLMYTVGPTSTALVDWAIDGVDQVGGTFTQTATTISAVHIGSAISGDVVTAYYDDLMASTTAADYPLDDGKILSAAPDSYLSKIDGSNYLQDDDSTDLDATSYTRLDDLPMTPTANYVKQTGVDANAYAEFGFADVTWGLCPRYVAALVAMHSSSATANSVKSSIFEGGTERIVASGSVNPGASIEHRYKLIPFTSGGAASLTFNALTARIGYASSVGSIPYWDAMRLEYELP